MHRRSGVKHAGKENPDCYRGLLCSKVRRWELREGGSTTKTKLSATTLRPSLEAVVVRSASALAPARGQTSVDAPPALPRGGGEYQLVGDIGDGNELFRLRFDMTAVADGDGSSSFAFVLPVEPGWEGQLASITLTGPGGSVTLDGESDLPTAILHAPRTRQVRGILRKAAGHRKLGRCGRRAVAGTRLGSAVQPRGIPDPGGWRP